MLQNKNLEDYLGKEIEIHYIYQGESIIETGYLHIKTEKGIYVGDKEKRGYHLINFDSKDSKNDRYGIRLIKDKNKEIIYDNKEIPFNKKGKVQYKKY